MLRNTRFLLVLTSRRNAHSGVDWSVPGKVLSLEQKLFYQKNGYIMMKSCVSQQDLDKFTERFNAICEKTVEPPKTMLVMKDVSIAKKETERSIDTITKVQDFGDDPVLFSYCETPKITDIVRDLVGNPRTNIQAMHTMLINKPPDTGKLTSRHPMHQDLIYFPWRPASLTVCAWTAMEKITRKNGCLTVVPGSHTGKLEEHGDPNWKGGVNKAYFAIKDYDMNLAREYVEMDAGDTIFFHPQLFHGSGANRSAGFRKAISCHYANYDESKYVDVSGTVQEELGKQIAEMVRKHPERYDLPEDKSKVDFEWTWRFRSRPVGHGGKKNL